MIKTPQIGDRVLWFGGGDRRQIPCPATVTAVDGRGRLNLNVCRPHSATFLLQAGVLHVDAAKPDEAECDGGWDWPPHAEQYGPQSSRAVAELKAKVDRLWEHVYGGAEYQPA